MIRPRLTEPCCRALNDYFILLVAIITLSCLASLPIRAATNAPRLKQIVEVDGPLVTLGDLFSNAGENGHVAVFRSPAPGTTGRVSTARVLAAAKKHNLVQKNHPTFEMVTISRSSRVVRIEELEKLIRQRLDDRYPRIKGRRKLIIRLPRALENLHYDKKVQGELNLSHFDWSAASERFIARFSLADSHLDPVVIKGTARLMVETGVAARDIPRGTAISQRDIELKYIKYNPRQSSPAPALEEMIGLVARRRLQQGRQINRSDLEKPRIIRKNQLVTILLEMPGLVLRTEGKALADAVKGDSVRILNTRSKRIIHATAIADGLVSVSPQHNDNSGS